MVLLLKTLERLHRRFSTLVGFEDAEALSEGLRDYADGDLNERSLCAQKAVCGQRPGWNSVSMKYPDAALEFSYQSFCESEHLQFTPALWECNPQMHTLQLCHPSSLETALDCAFGVEHKRANIYFMPDCNAVFRKRDVECLLSRRVTELSISTKPYGCTVFLVLKENDIRAHCFLTDIDQNPYLSRKLAKVWTGLNLGLSERSTAEISMDMLQHLTDKPHTFIERLKTPDGRAADFILHVDESSRDACAAMLRELCAPREENDADPIELAGRLCIPEELVTPSMRDDARAVHMAIVFRDGDEASGSGSVNRRERRAARRPMQKR